MAADLCAGIVRKGKKRKDFLRFLAVSCGVREIQILMKEAIAFTVWMKRCAEKI